MGILRWLLGRRLRTVVRLRGTGNYEFLIVGESKYQQALSDVGGKSDEAVEEEVEAELIAEPENRYDSHAVRVVIQRQTVGYLSRQNARDFATRMRSLGYEPQATCAAMICGAWDRGARGSGHFGVKLDIVWPVETR